ncbi:MAG TPA: cytochrome c [Roseiarcus sp.]|nr:cytochrome c [Roseiarcus sp.]
MKRLFLGVFCVGALAAAAGWLLSAPHPLYAREDWRAYEEGGDAGRGREVFLVGGCSSCHATPGQGDPLRLGGGYRLKTPFGSFFPPNISPDERDGVGRWKVVDLANTLLGGVSPDDAHDYPALPYTSYRALTFADVRDLMAYLRTLPKVTGRPPDHRLAFPFSIRRGVGLWKRIYLSKPGLTPDPSRSPEWNRGRYLVEGPGHCAECHSPRDFFGGIIASRRFAGGVTPDGKSKAPNISQSAKGLADWSREDIETALSLGLTPSGDSLGGPMAEVVRNLAQIPQSDRAAIADYVKGLPPVP